MYKIGTGQKLYSTMRPKRGTRRPLPGFDFSTTIILRNVMARERERSSDCLFLATTSPSLEIVTKECREKKMWEKRELRFLGNLTPDASGSFQGISHRCFIFHEKIIQAEQEIWEKVFSHYHLNLLSKYESVKFSLIESVICLFTD